MPRSSDYASTPAPEDGEPSPVQRSSGARARRGSGRAVLSDVAKRAGVSTATVSRVYNEPGKVSEQVRARVEQAALELNWFPNAAGRALASTRSHIAGIVIPTLDDQVFASQVSGMQASFAARGITLFLGCSNYDPNEALSQVHAMLARGVEAIAVVGEAHPPALFDALRVWRVPYVVLYAWREGSPHDCIGFDNHAAYREITEHLIGLGHRAFAVCLQSTHGNDRVQARLAGISAALARHGLAVRPEHLLEEKPRSISAGAPCARSGSKRDRGRVRSSAATTISRWACCGKRKRWGSPCPGSCPSRASTIWRSRARRGRR